jgi:hypothetical protein
MKAPLTRGSRSRVATIPSVFCAMLHLPRSADREAGDVQRIEFV